MKKKNLIKKADSLAVTSDTLGIFTNLFLNYKKNISNKNVNYLIIVKYIIVEIRQFFFRKRHKTLFRLWSLKDRKLLKSLRLE